jgi:hypothetical protein
MNVHATTTSLTCLPKEPGNLFFSSFFPFLFLRDHQSAQQLGLNPMPKSRANLNNQANQEAKSIQTTNAKRTPEQSPKVERYRTLMTFQQPDAHQLTYFAHLPTVYPAPKCICSVQDRVQRRQSFFPPSNLEICNIHVHYLIAWLEFAKLILFSPIVRSFVCSLSAVYCHCS